MGPILAYLVQIQASIFFLKNLALSVTRYHGHILSWTIPKKIMIQSWENLVKDRRRDKRTDRQTDTQTRVISWDTAWQVLSVQKLCRGVLDFFKCLSWTYIVSLSWNFAHGTCYRATWKISTSKCSYWFYLQLYETKQKKKILEYFHFIEA